MDISMFNIKDTSCIKALYKSPVTKAGVDSAGGIETFAEFGSVCLFQSSIPIKIRQTQWEEFCFL